MERDEYEANEIDSPVKEKEKTELLYRQFMLILQETPITKERLSLDYASLHLYLYGIEMANIVKLSADAVWVDSSIKKLKEIMPESQTGYAYGRAFQLGLYSYKGATEIPVFLAINNAYQKDIKTAQIKFSYYGSKKKMDGFYKIFTKIKDGKMKDWELYQSFVQHEKPLYLNIPYSDVWAELDKSKYSKATNGKIEENDLNGLISPSFFHKDLPETLRNLEKNTKNNNRTINVAVCKRWEDLFAEEISALYKIMNFCNNCGKALPFDYQGKYCPESKENEECIRKRARMRASKKSQV